MKKLSIVTIIVMTLLLGGCAQEQGQMKYIGADAAKAYALEAAGVTEKEAVFHEIDMATRNGLDYYRIIFSVGENTYKYQYDIDALTGVMIDSHGFEDVVDMARQENTPVLAGNEDAGLPEQDAVPLENNEVVQPGNEVAETGNEAIETGNNDVVQTGNEAAETGNNDVVQPGNEVTETGNNDAVQPGNETAQAGTQGSTQTGQQEQTMLTEAEAKAKALAHAGLKENQVTFVKVKKDYDDGRQVYEVEFYTSDYTEYDYEIDAYTGKILDYDYDAEDYKPSAGTQGSTQTGTLSAEEAKALALAQVPGATLSDIKEFERDNEDGRLVYEGTIRYGDREYEFEIDGYSGAIREWDSESIYDD